LEAGGTVLVDERSLWPDGRYPTTQLVVATRFLDDHPDVVRHLLAGQVAANAFVNAHPEQARQAANAEIAAITGNRLADAVLAAAWKNLTFTNDPISSSLRTSASRAAELELLGNADLDGIVDLTLLDEVLRAAGEPPIDPG
jgi:NitT/TauT family transport system substrate-binding protein